MHRLKIYILITQLTGKHSNCLASDSVLADHCARLQMMLLTVRSVCKQTGFKRRLHV